MTLDISRIRSLNERDRHSWHGAAFIVESLVLLAFLVASLAVTMQLMGAAHERGTEADSLSNAIVLASNDAEAFAANPASGDKTARFASVDGELIEAPDATSPDATLYDLVRTVERNDQDAGTLYKAHITVVQDGKTVYEVATSRYVSQAEVQR